MPSPPVFWFAALVACAAVGCDESPGEVNADYVRRAREAFELRVPRAAILAQLDSLLADEGLALANRDGDTLHTTVVPLPNLEDTTREYSIHLIPFADGGTQVHIVEIWRDAKGVVTRSERVPETEAELALRADPDRAQAILQEGNHRADEVAPRARPRVTSP